MREEANFPPNNIHEVVKARLINVTSDWFVLKLKFAGVCHIYLPSTILPIGFQRSKHMSCQIIFKLVL